MPTYTQLPDEQIAAVKAEATRRSQAQGISPEQALWDYAQSQGMDANKVDAYMGFAPGSSNKWLSQQGNPAAQPAPAPQTPQAQPQPAPQGNTYTAPAPQAAPSAQAPLTSGSTPQAIADSYRAWSGQNGGNTTANQTTAGNYLLNLGIGQSTIDNAVGIYKQAEPPQPAPQAAQPQYNPQQNPYLGQMGRDIGSQMFDNWSRNQMPSIRSGAMAAGGFGGSRQGVVEANGMNDMNRQYGQALTSMYGNDWSNQQNRNLQQQGLNNQSKATANSYDLGLRSSDLGFAGLDANIYQNNFNNQVTGANLGLNAYNALNNSNAGGTAAASTAQNQPINYFNQTSNTANAIGNGYGTSSGTTGSSSNGFASALGGAQMANSAYNNLGFSTPQVRDNGYSTGTGNAYAGTTTNGVWAPNRAGM